jgi:hypothetical protein
MKLIDMVGMFFIGVFLACFAILSGCVPKSLSQGGECPESFWRALEMAESGGNPATMYREDGIPHPDRVTGLPVIFSEGPYQLSYSDRLNFGADCDFKYAADREKFLEDVRNHMTGPKSFKAKNTDRTILQYPENRRCAEKILRTQLEKGTPLSRSYWSVIRRQIVKVPASCGAYLGG